MRFDGIKIVYERNTRFLLCPSSILRLVVVIVACLWSPTSAYDLEPLLLHNKLFFFLFARNLRLTETD